MDRDFRIVEAEDQNHRNRLEVRRESEIPSDFRDPDDDPCNHDHRRSDHEKSCEGNRAVGER